MRTQEEREMIKQEAIDMGAAIEGLGTIVMKRKTGKDNNIFGKVTHKQVHTRHARALERAGCACPPVAELTCTTCRSPMLSMRNLAAKSHSTLR